MKTIRKALLAMLVGMLALCGTGCSSSGGTAPVLTVGGVELTVGESHPASLTSEDFETTFPGNYMVIGAMPGKSWLSTFMVAQKEGKNYAYLYVYNPDREEKQYGLATIYRVDFDMNSEEADYWAEDNILVNGINFYGMDYEAVKEAMASYKLKGEADSEELMYQRYEDGKYKYIISFNKETKIVESVSVEMTISKSYNEAG